MTQVHVETLVNHWPAGERVAFTFGQYRYRVEFFLDRYKDVALLLLEYSGRFNKFFSNRTTVHAAQGGAGNENNVVCIERIYRGANTRCIFDINGSFDQSHFW